MSDSKPERILDSLQTLQAKIRALEKFQEIARNKSPQTSIDNAVLLTGQILKNKESIDFKTFQPHMEQFQKHWESARRDFHGLNENGFGDREIIKEKKAKAREFLNAAEPIVGGIKIRLARFDGSAEKYGLTRSDPLGNITSQQLQDQIIIDAVISEVYFDLIFREFAKQRADLLNKSETASVDSDNDQPLLKFENELRQVATDAWLVVKGKFGEAPLFPNTNSEPKINPALNEIIEKELVNLRYLLGKSMATPAAADTIARSGVKLQLDADSSGKMFVVGKVKNQVQAQEVAKQCNAILKPYGIECFVHPPSRLSFSSTIEFDGLGMDNALAKQLVELVGSRNNTTKKTKSPSSSTADLDASASKIIIPESPSPRSSSSSIPESPRPTSPSSRSPSPDSPVGSGGGFNRFTTSIKSFYDEFRERSQGQQPPSKKNTVVLKSQDETTPTTPTLE